MVNILIGAFLADLEVHEQRYHTTVSFLERLVCEAALHFNLSKYFFFAKAITSLNATSRSWVLQSCGCKKECTGCIFVFGWEAAY